MWAYYCIKRADNIADRKDNLLIFIIVNFAVWKRDNELKEGTEKLRVISSRPNGLT